MPVLKVPSDKAVEYNETLARMKKAMAFMDGPASLVEKEKWQPEFKQIERQLDTLIDEIAAAGYKITDEEIWSGFVFEEGEVIEECQ